MRALVAVLVLLTMLVAAAWWFQRRLIYFPATGPVAQAGSVIVGASDVTLHTSDGLQLGAWFVPPEGPERQMTVLVANGNAGDRSGRAALARTLAARGFAVLLFDYRGYGGNPGSPSQTGLALVTAPRPVPRRESRRGGRHRARDGASARGARPALAVRGSGLGGPGPLPVPSRQTPAPG
jgi:pimeloyl-ACP methyl ester carboxylesterase